MQGRVSDARKTPVKCRVPGGRRRGPALGGREPLRWDLMGEKGERHQGALLRGRGAVEAGPGD